MIDGYALMLQDFVANTESADKEMLKVLMVCLGPLVNPENELSEEEAFILMLKAKWNPTPSFDAEAMKNLLRQSKFKGKLWKELMGELGYHNA